MNRVPKSILSENSQPKKENLWVEGLKTIGFSLVFAIGIRSFVVEPRYIPSGSMLPTLQINDRLIIDKLSYRFDDPKRGDIVVFNPTEELKQQYKDAFIKRVIGMPGDQVELRNGQVYVNGKSLTENYIASEAEPEALMTQNTLHQLTVIEVCPPNKRFLAKPVTVPANHYIVMGDNRNHSYDSRCWGLVPREYIIGRAIFRFWPLNHLGEIDP